MTRVLEMKFNTANGKTMTISVNEPKVGLTPTEVSSAMQTIITQDVFHNEGNALVSINEARIVERTVAEIALS